MGKMGQEAGNPTVVGSRSGAHTEDTAPLSPSPPPREETAGPVRRSFGAKADEEAACSKTQIPSSTFAKALADEPQPSPRLGGERESGACCPKRPVTDREPSRFAAGATEGKSHVNLDSRRRF